MGVVDEHRLSTNGPVLSAGGARPPASVPAPEAKFGVAVIASPNQKHSAARPLGAGLGGRGGGGRAVRAVAREGGSPAVIGIPSFRPVALRPRLSTGLPLSLNLKCQIVADRRQV